MNVFMTINNLTAGFLFVFQICVHRYIIKLQVVVIFRILTSLRGIPDKVFDLETHGLLLESPHCRRLIVQQFLV